VKVPHFLEARSMKKHLDSGEGRKRRGGGAGKGKDAKHLKKRLKGKTGYQMV